MPTRVASVVEDDTADSTMCSSSSTSSRNKVAAWYDGRGGSRSSSSRRNITGPFLGGVSTSMSTQEQVGILQNNNNNKKKKRIQESSRSSGSGDVSVSSASSSHSRNRSCHKSTTRGGRKTSSRSCSLSHSNKNRRKSSFPGMCQHMFQSTLKSWKRMVLSKKGSDYYEMSNNKDGYSSYSRLCDDCNEDDEDEDEMSVDPLVTVIEKARNAMVRQRVRLVRFNLELNPSMDASSSPSHTTCHCCSQQGCDLKNKKCTTSIYGHRPALTSILHNGQNALTADDRVASDIQAFVKSVVSSSNIASENDVECCWVDDPISTNEMQDKKSVDPSLENFQPDPKILAQIQSLIEKGHCYQSQYKFPKAAKQYLEAWKKLHQHSYPKQHELQGIVQKSIHDVYHAHKNLEHTTNIVKIGLHLEAKGQLLRALKMYTVAFQIRKETLGVQHPSIPMLLNLLGSVQVKRGQYHDAMEIFELALYEKQDKNGKASDVVLHVRKNVGVTTLATSMREIGSIHEYFGRMDKAMDMYQKSIDCLMQDSRFVQMTDSHNNDTSKQNSSSNYIANDCSTDVLDDSMEICIVNTTSVSSETHDSLEEMEIYLQESLICNSTNSSMRNITNLEYFYNSFFRKPVVKADVKLAVHVANILHCIAKLHHKQQEFSLAMSSYHASLRGMKLMHGEKHQITAAILGNIGNLYKDMKDYERAHELYQATLKIQSLRLGFSHEDVLATMLNIAMIEKCRGCYDESIALYKEVVEIHHSRHHGNSKTTDLIIETHCSLGDVYEKIGNLSDAIKCYRDALEVQKALFHPTCRGKLLHKLGILCSKNGQHQDADVYFFNALEYYKTKNIFDKSIVLIERDKADNMGSPSFVQ